MSAPEPRTEAGRALKSAGPAECSKCGEPLEPLDWDTPGFWFHDRPLGLVCPGRQA